MKLAYGSIILALCAYVMPATGRILVLTAPGFVGSLVFSVRIILAAGPILAIGAVILGHIARRIGKDEASQKAAGVALAGLILGYIFLAYAIFAASIAAWFSHAMKDFG